MYSFLQKHSNEEYILIGDFNTINNRNMEEFRKILYNAYDIWYQKGNREPLSCMGDYAISRVCHLLKNKIVKKSKKYSLVLYFFVILWYNSI